MNWIEYFRLVRDIGHEIVIPLLRAIRDNDAPAAQANLDQALSTGEAAGRAASEASRYAGRPAIVCAACKGIRYHWQTCPTLGRVS